jgi:hypothetical protein
MVNQEFLTVRQKLRHFLLVSFCRGQKARRSIELQGGAI